MTEQEAAALLIAEMDKQGVTDNGLRAGIAAIAMGESQMTPHTETDYAHTGDSRIRQVFGSRVAGLTDGQIDALKVDPKAFFNRVYGGSWGKTSLGNTEPDDGYNFRGRTMLQLTGRANYQKLQELTGYPIIANPDMANDPQVSAAIAVAYMRWRYKGGGWPAMKAVVGNNTPDIDATKNRYYSQFIVSGEFDYRPGSGAQVAQPVAPPVPPAPNPQPAPVAAPTRPVAPPVHHAPLAPSPDDTEELTELTREANPGVSIP